MSRSWTYQCEERAIASAPTCASEPNGPGGVPSWIRIVGNGPLEQIQIEVFRRLILRIRSADCTCAWYWRTVSGAEIKMGCQPSLLRPLSDSNVLALLGQDLIGPPVGEKTVQMASPQQCAQAMRVSIESDPALRHWPTDWYRILRGVLGSLLELALLAEPAKGCDIRPEVVELVWQNQAAFEDVRINNAGLLPVMSIWLLCGRELKASESPLRTLRTAVSGILDCGPATWRWLQCWGIAPILPLVHGTSRGDNRRSQWSALSRVLRLWTRAGLPPPLRQQVAMEWGRRIRGPQDLLTSCPERLAIIASYVHARKSSPLDMEEVEELGDCLMRLEEDWQPLDRNQKRAGWKWLRRDIHRFSMSVPFLVPLEDEAFPVLIEPTAVSGVRFVPLLNFQAIEEEGREQQHCMGEYPGRFIQSGMHFSLRCAETDRRLATCTFAFRGHRLVLRQFSGYHNARPCRRIFTAMKTFGGILAKLNEDGRHRRKTDEAK